MSRVRSRRARFRAGEGLSTEERDSLMLFGLGAFPDHATRRAAWLYARDFLIDQCAPTARPGAFWQYEPGIPDTLRERDTSSVEAFQQQAEARRAWLREHAR